MPKFAALFGGQGSQYPGMGKDLYDQFGCAREIYAKAGEVLGFDLAEISFSGSEEELGRTEIAQPAIFTHAAAALAVFQEQMDLRFEAAAGHSLGEFAALYCAGAYTLENGLRLVRERAKAMGEAKGHGAMYAIVGSDEQTVAAACVQAGGEVQPVNFNLPNQTVISGDADDCARAALLLAEKGAKTVRLAVSSAFHTGMMKEAAAQFRAAAEQIEYRPLRCDFYSNLTGARLEVDVGFPAYFEQHMVSPVQFVRQMRAMRENGATHCVEFGPKKTAVTLAKKNVREFTVYNVEDAQSLEKTIAALEAAKG